VAFVHHVGIASLNAQFGGEVGFGGIYHSVYDSFDWYTRFSDTDFTHARALAQIYTTAVLRLAQAEVLPFEFRAVVRSMEEWVKDLPKVELAALQSAMAGLRRAAEEYESKFNHRGSKELNAALIRTERALLLERGLPGRPWYKHQLMAPGVYTGYSAKTLPAIRDSKDPQAGVTLVVEALQNYAAAIQKAATLF
jgi:N-acetylated-alpha-linked acidic dipeptidase